MQGGENPERVKVTAEMIADYNSMDAWDPNADAEMGGLTVIEGYVYPKVDFKDVGIFVGDNKDELVLVLDLPLELLKEDGKLFLNDDSLYLKDVEEKGNIIKYTKNNIDIIQTTPSVMKFHLENLENKIEHHQEVIDTFKKENAELKEAHESELLN